jgi:hypothetical protein
MTDYKLPQNRLRTRYFRRRIRLDLKELLNALILELFFIFWGLLVAQIEYRTVIITIERSIDPYLQIEMSMTSILFQSVNIFIELNQNNKKIKGPLENL